jgi:hypothetical protein
MSSDKWIDIWVKNGRGKKYDTINRFCVFLIHIKMSSPYFRSYGHVNDIIRRCE